MCIRDRDREGRTVKASCTCHDFRRAGLKQGPCPHMIALRLRYAREQAALEQARETPEGRKLIRAETRTLTRRQGERVLSYRISLDAVSYTHLAPTWCYDLRYRLINAHSDDHRARHQRSAPLTREPSCYSSACRIISAICCASGSFNAWAACKAKRSNANAFSRSPAELRAR